MAAPAPTPLVTVDVEARVAWVQAGARWGDVERETRRHGLAVPGGVLTFGPGTPVLRSYPLRPLERPVLKLNVMYDIADGSRVMHGWAGLVAAAPPELTVECGVWSIPDLPELPAELRGRRTALVAGTWEGAVQDGYAAIRPYRTLAQPLLDLTGPGDDRLARVRALSDPGEFRSTAAGRPR